MINIFAILDQKYFWVNSHICHLLQQSSCIPALCSDCRVHHFLAIQRYALQFSCAQTAVKLSFPGQSSGTVQWGDQLPTYWEGKTVISPVMWLSSQKFLQKYLEEKKRGNNLWLCTAADLICIYHRLGSIGMRWYHHIRLRWGHCGGYMAGSME